MINTKIEKVTMPKEKAKKLWREYCKTLKTREKDYKKEIKEIKQCYYQLSKGRAIINIVDVFKKFGLNELGHPLLAFAPAKERFVVFRQSTWSENRGNASFTSEGWQYKTFLDLNVFPHLKRDRDCELRTSVPLIPPKFLPKTLRGCFLLWEVENWETLRPKRDPILLKKLSGNLYAVLATWNLTKIEAMIISGR